MGIFAVIFFVGLACFLLGMFTVLHFLYILGIIALVVGGVGWIATSVRGSHRRY